jgi:hypothetical protein
VRRTLHLGRVGTSIEPCPKVLKFCPAPLPSAYYLFLLTNTRGPTRSSTFFTYKMGQDQSAVPSPLGLRPIARVATDLPSQVPSLAAASHSPADHARSQGGTMDDPSSGKCKIRRRPSAGSGPPRRLLRGCACSLRACLPRTQVARWEAALVPSALL